MIFDLHITLTICTRHRPELLEACLRSLLRQKVPDRVRRDLIVCENDDQPKAKALCDSLGPRVIYVQEPEPGLSSARNRAIETALDMDCDWIGFIDDDEQAEPGWVEALTAEIRRDRADVITGPVTRAYETSPSAWYSPFDENRKPTGAVSKTIEAGKTVCRRHLFDADGLALRFDPRLRFVGGEDSDLFGRARAAGVRFVWCDEMVADEFWTAARLTRMFHLRRALRRAESRVYILSKRHSRLAAVPMSLAKSTIWSRETAPCRIHQAWEKLFAGWGGLRGSLGFLSEPYRGR
ncbi:glycosyltransferase family 2 protein [Roseobacter sp. HKCCA0434]|uniref:glycosyltransferase family 2 protein n=1 Tax=Roseobacter sp. HKCCA0434 TaxID=3079297 RepID=UPI002905A364|nr:glycosyltransferase [Roseobacter sp. HKCCA0434]